MKLVFTLGSLLILSGCAGAGFELPSVDEASIAAVNTRMSAAPLSLEIYSRTADENRKIIDKVANKIAKVSQPLCDISDNKNCFIQFEYNESGEINAYAHDFNKVTLNLGLLKYLKTEDEFAAVMGHEMGHHLADHLAEQQRNAAAGAAVAGIFTAILLGAASNGYYQSPYQQQQNQNTVEDMMRVGGAIGQISFSKEQEREADMLGAYIIKRAGYDLDKAGRIFEVLTVAGHDQGKTKSGMFSSHPIGPERLAAWEKIKLEIGSNPTLLPKAVKKTQHSLSGEQEQLARTSINKKSTKEVRVRRTMPEEAPASSTGQWAQDYQISPVKSAKPANDNTDQLSKEKTDRVDAKASQDEARPEPYRYVPAVKKRKVFNQ